MFRFSVWCLAVLALVTGCVDFFVGLSAQKMVGAALMESDYGDPLLNSQVRYLGSIWFGFGVFLIAALRNLPATLGMLRGGLLIVLMGGVGRVISLVQFGFPPSPLGTGFVIFALVIELVCIPAMLWLSGRETAALKPRLVLES